MPNVTIDHGRHIIDYGDHDQSHLLREFPDAIIETHDTLPNGIRRGNYLFRNGRVDSPRDGHRTVHESEHWQEAVAWALRENENILRARMIDPDDDAKVVVKVFGGILYSVLFAASNIENRLSFARWNYLKRSMVTWKEFSLRIGYHDALPFVLVHPDISYSLEFASLINQEMRYFLDEDNIYVYNPVRREIQHIRGRRVDSAADAPLSGDGANHFLVRDILGYTQDTRVTEDIILQMDVTDRNGTRVANLSPEFNPNVFDYVVETDRDHVYIGYNAYNHMRVFGLDFEEVGNVLLGRVDLTTGRNTVVRLRTQSQEGSDSQTYSITIRQTG